jgi:hypothetical protein
MNLRVTGTPLTRPCRARAETLIIQIGTDFGHGFFPPFLGAREFRHTGAGIHLALVCSEELNAQNFSVAMQQTIRIREARLLRLRRRGTLLPCFR